MRDYLYLWHSPAIKRLVVSGIEFADVVPELAGTGGIVLLRHQFNDEFVDPVSRLQFVPTHRLARLAAGNICDYGDFCWADYGAGVSLAALNDHSVADLMFFSHAARPFATADIAGLDNRFLYFAHDEPWYARIFYSDWSAINALLQRLLPCVLSEQQASETLQVLRHGSGAFWCSDGIATQCAETEDIDALQRIHLPKGWRPPPRRP